MTTPLLDRSFEELEQDLIALGEPAYRTQQIVRWVLRDGARSFEEMTNLPAALRALLARRYRLDALPVLAERATDDGATTKALLDLGDGDAVEAVRMDYDPDAVGTTGRTTVCISTQVGCAMGCVFCATGLQGFTRNLTPHEIVAQVLHFARERRVTNVVYMGMGEPLANLDATLRSIHWLVDGSGLDLRQRGVTVSTVGIPRAIRRLAEEEWQIGLAISLHAPDDELRRQLIPTAAGTSIDDLLDAARDYIERRGRRVTFAYALLDRVNDSPAQARALARRIRGIQAHVNLIPYNPTAGPDLRRPTRDRVRAFQRELQAAGVNATVRIERGAEIAAACGQLRSDMQPDAQPTATADNRLIQIEGSGAGG